MAKKECDYCGDPATKSYQEPMTGNVVHYCDEHYDEFVPRGICEDCGENPATYVSDGTNVCGECYGKRYHI